MASLRRKVGSQFYFACFRGPDGARLQVSTKETNKNRAMKAAIALEEAAARRTSRGALLDAFNRISQDLYSAPLRVESTRAFFEATITQRKGEISESSARRYQQVAKLFLDHLKSAADSPFRDISYDQIIAFRNSVAARTSNSNANAYIKCLRNFFTRALSERVILDDPTKRLKPLAKEKRTASEKRRPFRPDEIARLLVAAEATSAEWRWMVVLGLLTGQRLGDVATVHWSNFEYVDGEVVVWKFNSGKTERDMVLPLPRTQVDQMAKELGSEGPGSDAQVFPDANRMYCVAGRTSPLSNQFTGIMGRAGIQEIRDHKAHKEGRTRARAASKLGFHSLRHTVTSMLSAAGVPRSVIMDFVGHDSPEMSQVYTHTELNQKTAAQAKLLAAVLPLGGAVKPAQ